MKGSFTGAISDKPGAAAAADGGTLFLDEICEMAPALQTKLCASCRPRPSSRSARRGRAR
jgi:transcriptional regulator with PAS, ATPase and Fis domain